MIGALTKKAIMHGGRLLLFLLVFFLTSLIAFGATPSTRSQSQYGSIYDSIRTPFQKFIESLEGITDGFLSEPPELLPGKTAPPDDAPPLGFKELLWTFIAFVEAVIRLLDSVLRAIGRSILSVFHLIGDGIEWILSRFG